MPFDASVIKVMIASPSDVPDERVAIREIVAEWNHVHAEERRQVLFPVGWETHSTPTMGDRPQAIINKQVLADCDLLVAVFWTRLGSATGVAKSGTVEEIEEHLKAGKPAMLYFSNCPVHPGSIDKQYKALTKFKEECFRRGIVHAYETPQQFRDEFRRQLAQKIIQEFPATGVPASSFEAVLPRPGLVRDMLSADAKDLLIAACVCDENRKGVVVQSRTLSGVTIQAGSKLFVRPSNGEREEARWESAVDEVEGQQLIEDRGYKREVFKVTHRGYGVCDELRS